MTDIAPILSRLRNPARLDLEETLRGLGGAPYRASPRTRYNLACELVDQAGLAIGQIPPDETFSTAQVRAINRAIQILGDDSHRAAANWALDDPALWRLRTSPWGARFRAATRRGGLDSGAWPLSRIDAIGVDGAEVLARTGIVSAKDLMRRAGPKDARAVLAKATGRDAAQLHAWAQLAELAESVVDPASRRSPKGAMRRDGRALDVANLLGLGAIQSVDALRSATEKASPKLFPPEPPRTSTEAIEELAASLTRLNRRERVVAFGDGDQRPRAHDFVVTPAFVRRWRNAAVPSGMVEPEVAPATDSD